MSSSRAARKASSLGKALISLHHHATHDHRVRIISLHVAQAIEAHAPRNRPLRCLDVGCGNMQLAELLAEALPPTSWICLDIYEPPEDLAGQERWAKYRRFDGRTLCFAEGAFDVVLFSDVLHHAQDDAETLLAEAARVGRLVLVKDHFEYSLWSRCWLWLMDFLGNWSYGVPLPKRYFTPDGFARKLAEAGLRVRNLCVGLDLYRRIPVARTLLRRKWQFLAVLEPAGITEGTRPRISQPPMEHR